MRHLLAIATLVILSACGQPASTTNGASPPAWRAALTEHPRVFRSYSPARGLAPLEGGTVTDAGSDTALVSTPAANGAWAAMLVTGPDGDAAGTALRIRARVESGALTFGSIYAGADPSLVSATETVQAGGETVVYVPLDRGGNPVLVVANGATGQPSTGTVSEISLVGPP